MTVSVVVGTARCAVTARIARGTFAIGRSMTQIAPLDAASRPNDY